MVFWQGYEGRWVCAGVFVCVCVCVCLWMFNVPIEYRNSVKWLFGKAIKVAGYVQVCVCIYVYVYVCKHDVLIGCRNSMWSCMYVCIHVFMYGCVQVCVCICM